MDKPELLPTGIVEYLQKILPTTWMEKLKKHGLNNLCEIRIRVGQPILLKYLDTHCFLGEKIDDCFVFLPTIEEVEQIVFLACNKSIYAYVGQLINGFLSCVGGIRIGVCGEITKQDGKIVGIKNFSSINIRIPHAVNDCALSVKKFFLNPLKSVLIVSPPGCGKTTFLRDMIFQLRFDCINTFIVDEREEICCFSKGKSWFKLNKSYDVLANSDKEYAFEWGIRSMSPDLIVCDEVFKKDLINLKNVIKSGVKIFASIHADNYQNALQKLQLNTFEHLFEVVIVLSNRFGVGTIEGVFNDCGEQLL